MGSGVATSNPSTRSRISILSSVVAVFIAFSDSARAFRHATITGVASPYTRSSSGLASCVTSSQYRRQHEPVGYS